MEKRFKQKFQKGRYMNVIITLKIPSFISHQRNTKLNNNDVPPYINVKKIGNIKCWQGYEKMELSQVAGGKAKQHSQFGKQCVNIKLRIYFPIMQQFYFHVFTQEKLKHMSTQRSEYKCSQLHYSEQPQTGSNSNVHQLVTG